MSTRTKFQKSVLVFIILTMLLLWITTHTQARAGQPVDQVHVAGIGLQVTATASSTPTSTITATANASPTWTPTHHRPFQPDTIGVYKDGAWYLRASNTPGTENYFAVFGGDPSDLPVVGDWNGDAADGLGVYRSSTGFFFLSDSITTPAVDYTVLFGNPGDTPFAGRWLYTMTHDGLGVYRNSNGIYHLKIDLTMGVGDFSGVYGDPGDQIFTGDFQGSDLNSIGVYRSGTGHWFLSIGPDFDWPIGTGMPIAGAWSGTMPYTPATVGYLSAAGVFVLHSSLATSGTDIVFAFGPLGGKPVAGKWFVAAPFGALKPPGNVIIRGGGNPNPNGDGHQTD